MNLIKKLKNKKVYELLFKIIICFSSPFFTILLSNRFEVKHIFIGALFSLIIIIVLSFRFIKIKTINLKRIILSTLIALYVVNKLLSFAQNNILMIQKGVYDIINLNLNFDITSKLLGVFALPFTIFIAYLFINNIIPYVKTFFKSLSKNEKNYLIIIGIIGGVVAMLLTFNTSAFSKTYYNNQLVYYDVIYTSDSGVLTSEDTFFNVSYLENDVRQPLFGIFALPFAVIASVLSEICFFLPTGFEYEVLLTVIQFLLTAITTIMLARLLNIEEKDKKYFYMLFAVSFPYLLFNIVVEQYVISLFYLVLAIYLYYKNNDKINYVYIGAVGTMLTSGIIFPLITKFKGLKNWIKDVFKCFIAFLTTLIIGGQFPQLLIGGDRLGGLTGEFIGKVGWGDKLNQFTHFVKNIFISSNGQVKMLYDHPSYQLKYFETISILGIIILLLVILSFVLNRKEKLAKISFLWVLFSVFVLFIMGWGTFENGLILYSLYFAWAYIILIYLLLKKLIKNRKIFISFIVILISVMLFFNLSELLNIIKFALKYY